MSSSGDKFEEGIRFQLRRDLQFSEYNVDVGTQLVVKDPVKLEYFLFESFERTLLNLLQKPLTVEQLKQKADQFLRPGHTDLSEVRRFLKRLLADNLITTDQAGMGTWFGAKKQAENRNARFQSLFSMLAIRFRGINPQPILDGVNPATRFLFQPMFLVAAAVLFLVSVAAAVLNVSLVFESDFLWKNLREPGTILLIGIALIVVKVLHEFGHALACRSINRECHEMGVLLLAFVPCLYCNVSDVWMEPNRWKRMLVSAAGIYVEMLVAIVCVPLWMFSTEGPLQVFWFAMITICTVNTLLINGNPLLRYDGYYLLSDWLGIPNLYNVAQKKIDRRVGGFFARDVKVAEPYSFLDLYGVLSRIYRVFILAVIIFAVYSFLENIELPNVGIAVASILFATTFGISAIGSVKKLSRLDRRKTRVFRVFFVAGLSVALLIATAFVPVTTRIYADGEVSLRQDGIIYAPDDGKVVWMETSGRTVILNQPIGKIENRSLQWSILRQQQRIKELQLNQKNQELLRSQGADNAAEIELTSNALGSAQKILAELEGQQSELTIFSPLSGTLQPMPENVSPKLNDLDLERQSSTLFAQNQNSVVKSGEPLALVANPDQQKVVLKVDEKQIGFVTIGQEVRMLIGQNSPAVVLGIVDDISIDKIQDQPRFQPVEVDSKGRIDVHVLLKNTNDSPFFQSRVRGVVLGSQVPIYRWLWRKLLENFEI